VYGLRFEARSSWYRLWGDGSRVDGLWYTVQGLGCEVQGVRCRA
jgi:hypothetical protein